MKDGKCSACGSYSYPAADGQNCTSDKDDCTKREKLTVLGTCEECKPFEAVLSSGTACGNPCGDRHQISKEGDCKECSNYERAQDDGTACGPDTCSAT